MEPKYIIGIDEAGRGPLAGPVAVAAVCVPIANKPRGKQKDSKQLTAKQREELFLELKQQQRENKLKFAVALVGHKYIDERGIAAAIRLGIKRCLERLGCEPGECLVLLDGSLRASAIYINQKTIIGGDASEPIIALASIVAKVHRDRRMIRLSQKYPNYGFAVHKGYGTLAHYQALKQHGLSPIHRRSFLKKLQVAN
jgi:ribonuclease HII